MPAITVSQVPTQLMLEYRKSFGKLCEYLNRMRQPNSDALVVEWVTDAGAGVPHQNFVTLKAGGRSIKDEEKKESENTDRDEWLGELLKVLSNSTFFSLTVLYSFSHRILYHC